MKYFALKCCFQKKIVNYFDSVFFYVSINMLLLLTVTSNIFIKNIKYRYLFFFALKNLYERDRAHFRIFELLFKLNRLFRVKCFIDDPVYCALNLLGHILVNKAV